MRMVIEKINPENREKAMEPVLSVFIQYEAPDYSEEGVQTFINFINNKETIDKLEMYGAFNNGKIAGVIATRNWGTFTAFIRLHKIHPLIQYDDAFINLINEVRTIRSYNKMCQSAQPGINISEVLHAIIKNSIYKKDYYEITHDLLFEKVSYPEVMNTLKAMMNTGIFDNEFNLSQ